MGAAVHGFVGAIGSQITSRPDVHHLSALFCRREQAVGDGCEASRQHRDALTVRPDRNSQSPWTKGGALRPPTLWM